MLCAQPLELGFHLFTRTAPQWWIHRLCRSHRAAFEEFASETWAGVVGSLDPWFKGQPEGVFLSFLV
jgi:hypothetical protein